MSEAHSKIGASSSYRWFNCPGSVRESEGIEGFESEYAREGTLAHELAATWLETGHKPSFKGCPVDMEAAVTQYVESVFFEVDMVGAKLGETFFVELKVDLHDIDKRMFSTLDCVIYDKLNARLITKDYKHGAGIPVEVKGNTQLYYYGLAAFKKFKWPVKHFSFDIIQPRCDHPDGVERRETIHHKKMWSFEKLLIEKVEAVNDPNAPLKAGDWCRFCPALTICPEVKKTRTAMAKKVFSKEIKSKPEDISKALEAVPVLKDWIRSVEEAAYHQALKGDKIPGFKLVEKRATRKWDDEEEIKKMIVNSYKREHWPGFFTQKLKSPTQLEKLLNKKHLKKFSSHIVKKSSGLVLVSESDKRQEAKVGGDAKEAFKDLLIK